MLKLWRHTGVVLFVLIQMAVILETKYKTISKKKTGQGWDGKKGESQTERDFIAMYYTRTATAVYKRMTPAYNTSVFKYYKRKEYRKEMFKQAGLRAKYSYKTTKAMALKDGYFMRQRR